MNEQPKTVWIAHCTTHGPVRIEQVTPPSHCKEKIKHGARSIRQCGQTLIDIRSTRGVK